MAWFAAQPTTTAIRRSKSPPARRPSCSNVGPVAARKPYGPRSTAAKSIVTPAARRSIARPNRRAGSSPCTYGIPPCRSQAPRLNATCVRARSTRSASRSALLRVASLARPTPAKSILPFSCRRRRLPGRCPGPAGRRGYGRSEEHTSELQSLMRISYSVFFLKKKNYYILYFISFFISYLLFLLLIYFFFYYFYYLFYHFVYYFTLFLLFYICLYIFSHLIQFLSCYFIFCYYNLFFLFY